MNRVKLFALAAVAGICLAGSPAMAETNININIGPEPVCPYGYFGYAPYSCAPLGYYGPTWFVGGVFVGAGRWFHGPDHFRGYIDRGFDPRYGYAGPLPYRNERADWARHHGWEKRFRGSEYRDEYRHDNGHHYGQYKEHGNPHYRDHDHGNGHDHGHGHDR
ncbi:MAG TPA: hypothetical protein VFI20_00690 [Terracidiphilus sp.]|nr:hypothetical protein [Terracidiphilus sp.]